MILAFLIIALVPLIQCAPSEPPVPAALAPLIETLKSIKAKHLKSDPGFQAAAKYFKSPEWIQIIEDIRKNEAWIDYKTFLKGAGVDPEPLIQHLEHCMNATDVSEFKVDDVQPDLNQFIEDVKMTQGVQILKSVGDAVDPEKTLAKLASDEGKEKLKKVISQAEFQKAEEKLKEMGLDLNVFFDIILAYKH